MLKINFMGDVMFGELLETFRRGLSSTLEKRNVDPFEHVRPVLDEGDLNVINLECVFSDFSILRNPLSKILIAPEKFLPLLVDNGIKVVNTANNHALDHGLKAFERSCDLVRSQGIHIIGYNQDRFFQDEPVILEVKGHRVGFLGYNISNFPVEDRDQVMDRIVGVLGETSTAVDLTVVSIHWGEEYTHIPPPYVVAYGRKILAAGCDILHGHHSHQIQGVHNQGNKIFAPSLGNFIFDQLIPENRITAILQVDLEEGTLSHKYLPYYLNDRFQPEPAPRYAGYLTEINELLKEILAGGSEHPYTDAINKRVQAGHRKNRLRMRLKMLEHFWDYLPHIREIRQYQQSRQAVFSVIVGQDSLPD